MIGGGCASIAAAFELSRPEHNGKYQVTVYQLGWRLGGKGASGRGPANRIEEHGLHLWMGSYENAFRLVRECYAELNRDRKKCRIADWRDAFFPMPFIGLTHRLRDGSWRSFIPYFPPADGLPGDPLSPNDSFSVTSYLARAAGIMRTLMLAVQDRTGGQEPRRESGESDIAANMTQRLERMLRFGLFATTAAIVEAVGLLELIFAPGAANPMDAVAQLLEMIGSSASRQLEAMVETDFELQILWQAIDLGAATMRGILRFGLVSDRRGFDAINDYDFRDWLRINGASERSLDSAIVRGAYDLVFAYENGDASKPRHGAGVMLRGALRMLFSSRGAIFWKMRAGMGDVVFAPYYEVLKKRGVSFQFFHRLRNVKLANPKKLARGERPHVEELAFEVQAKVKGNDEYAPLLDVDGLPCWPAKPDFAQLVDGDRLAREQRNFESHWERRKAGTRRLRVSRDFDFVVLGIGLGAIPHVCAELVKRDARWRDMVTHLKTVETQAFQIWLRDDMEQLGWSDPPVALSAFVHPFDTWADMRHLIREERWNVKPGAIAYFCSAMKDSGTSPSDRDSSYPARRRRQVRSSAIRFLNRDIGHLWPKAAGRSGGFRWELLMDPTERTSSRKAARGDESRFDCQHWTANVEPSERYVLSLPGTQKYRISPLDNAYDNLTIAGDWTACGLDTGCVEAAVISGRLAAHAISSLPALDDIIAFDHP